MLLQLIIVESQQAEVMIWTYFIYNLVTLIKENYNTEKLEDIDDSTVINYKYTRSKLCLIKKTTKGLPFNSFRLEVL